MNPASDIRRILAPWYIEGQYSTQRQPFISRDQILSLRLYAGYTTTFYEFYNQMCVPRLRHSPLRRLLNSPSYTGLAPFVQSGNDWRTLDRDLLKLGNLLLDLTGQLASEGRQLLQLIEKMDFMEQWGHTIGDLTEEMLDELESRPLSTHDIGIRNSLPEKLLLMMFKSLGAALVAQRVKNQTSAFSSDVRRTILPSMEHLRDLTLAERCPVTRCTENLDAVAARLNLSLQSGELDSAATTLNDLTTVLITYLQSATEDLSSMDNNLQIVMFAMQFDSVIEAWQSVEKPLQDLISALKP